MHICLQKITFRRKRHLVASVRSLRSRGLRPLDPAAISYYLHRPPGFNGSEFRFSGALLRRGSGLVRPEEDQLHVRTHKMGKKKYIIVEGERKKAFLLLLLRWQQHQEAKTWFFWWETALNKCFTGHAFGEERPRRQDGTVQKQIQCIIHHEGGKTPRQSMLKNLLHYYRSTTPP